MAIRGIERLAPSNCRRGFCVPSRTERSCTPLEIAYCQENVEPVVTLARRGLLFGVLALVLAASVVLDVFKIRVFRYCGLQ